MALRLKAGIFVSALIRQAQGRGLFASVLRKGDEDAGAIYITIRARDGRLRCFAPAEQANYESQSMGRSFRELNIVDEQDLAAFIAKESRFDSDLWLVEIEDDALEAPVDLIKPPPAGHGLF